MKKPAEVFHPGEFLQDEMDARGWSVEFLSSLTDVSPKKLRSLIEGKRKLTPFLCAKLAKAFSTSFKFWDKLGKAYENYMKEAQ